MALPHITNSQAGRNKYEPLYKSLFEVYFTLPPALQDEFNADEALITEHVQTIGGLQTNKPVGKATQKFMGTTRSYAAAKLDDTSYEVTVKLSLNLRNNTDNYIYKIFRRWLQLAYNLDDGTTALKTDYCADWLKCTVGNRAGDIYREILMKDVWVNDIGTGMDDYDYSSATDLQELEVKFISDWAEETNA